MPFRKSDSTRNSKMDALTTLFNGGSLEWRSGPIPTTPAVADSGVLLATNTCAATAFSVAVAGLATYNTDTPNIQVGVGSIGHCRAKTSGGLVIGDFDVGTAGTSIIVDRVTIAAGEKVNVTSFTMEEPL